MTKKTFMLNILEILKKYSDENHNLSQKEIAVIMKREFDVEIGRKAVKRNLDELIALGYPIEYAETVRKSKNGTEEAVCSDWYLERDFTDAELRLLIESLLFSKYIPYSQCKELIQKLKGLSSTYFGENMKYISAMPENRSENKQLLYTVEILSEAIATGKKVTFHYSRYGTDKHRHRVQNEDGTLRKYTVSPYRMAVANARYFLLCSHDKGDLFHYRIDSIMDIEITEETVRPFKNLKGREQNLDLSKYMAEHIHMFSGKTKRICFRTKKVILDAVFDWFDRDDIRLSDETAEEITVWVTGNEQDMLYWALQYGKYVEILCPQSLREAVRDTVREMAAKYEKPIEPKGENL